MKFAALALFATSLALPAELHFCIRSDPKTLEPLAVTDQSSDLIRHLTTSSLVRRDKVSQKIEPHLAEKFVLRDQGRTLAFTLRPGVRFSDGTPLDSADVRGTLQRLLDPVKKLPGGEGLRTADVSAIETPGPLLVLVRTGKAIAGLEALFEDIPILSSRSPLGDKASSGPFVLEEYKRGYSLRLVRNSHYFKKDHEGHRLPKLDGIRIDIQANSDLERSRFERGEIHMLQSTDPETFMRLEKAGMARDAGPSMESEMLWFNQAARSPLAAHKKDWFRSREFRRAVSSAIRREDLVRVVYGGRAQPGVGPITLASSEWFHPRLRSHPFDLKDSMQRLQKAGFRMREGTLFDAAGNAINFSLITNAGNRFRMRMAVMIQQDLEKIGIKVNVVTLDMPSLLERMTRTLDYDAILLGIVGVDVDPNDQLNIWMSSSASHSWNPSQATPETPWEAEIDRLLREQSHAVTAAKRRPLLHRFQEIVSEEAPMIYLVHPHALVAVSPRLLHVRPASLHPRVLWNVEELALRPEGAR